MILGSAALYAKADEHQDAALKRMADELFWIELTASIEIATEERAMRAFKQFSGPPLTDEGAPF